MSGRRWGDSSDEEDDDNHVSIAHSKVQVSSANEPHRQLAEEADFSPITDQEYVDYNDNAQTDDAQNGIPDEEPVTEEEQEVEPESEDEDEQTRQRRIEVAKEAAAKKKAEQEAKKKTATVEDQLDNLDDILNEFGIETQSPNNKADSAKNGNGEASEPAGDSSDVTGSPTSRTVSKRKKPKKKKSENGGHEDGVSERQEPDKTATPALDPDAAAKVLKAKVAASKSNTKKPMSTAQSAAAAAVKEMKSSGDDKKKKKKSKQLAQNFGR